MTGNQVFIVEMVLVFGLVLAWAVWEVFSTRRSLKRDRDASAERARHSEGQHGADEGRPQPPQ
jgi:heme/copper-type cytochrome/quinol oxidase subunit 2